MPVNNINLQKYIRKLIQVYLPNKSIQNYYS